MAVSESAAEHDAASMADAADAPPPQDNVPTRRRAPLAVWFSKLGIRPRIAIGFIASLSLLVIIAVAAIIGIKRGDQAFTTYDAVVENGRLGQAFERDLLDLRRNLLLYVERDDPRGLLALRRVEPQLNETLAAMIDTTADQQRLELLKEIDAQLKQTFNNLGQAIAARNKLKEINGSQLEVYGPRTRDVLVHLVRAANQQNKFAVAAEAGLVLDTFSEIRIAATRFIGQGDMAMANEASGKVLNFVEASESLKLQLADDAKDLHKMAEEAEGFATQYGAGILEASKVAGDVNRLIYQEIETAIAEINDRLEKIKISQIEELRNERVTADAAFDATFLTVLVMALAALGVGIIFAWLIGRSIANPIAALTTSMGILAEGDYSAAIPGLERGDEIGRMAAAVEVFKRNGAENERLRGEVEAERAAAEQRRIEQDNLLDRAVGEIVAAAAAGDLTQRIDTAPLSGVAAKLGGGVNPLLDTIGAAIDEVGGVLAGLAKGDLTHRVTGDYRGVFAKLKDDVNTASANLADALRQIADSANTVRDAANEISVGSQDLSQRTESQAAALEQTAASMHEVTATVKQNAENAQAANQLALSARSTAEAGGKVVSEAVRAMSEIEGSAQKISDIVGLIDEIAFQTNLLALNASVEAARAGEAGKGFAVVAQEVRALAQRSANASKDIKALIQTSNGQVKSGAALVNQAGDSLSEIVTAVKKVSDIIAEIATASAEQARGLEEVNGAVTNMDEMTQRNGALVEETTASAQTLANQSDELATLIARFRLA
jgi:methyl-accepting chemotaxis protein